MNRCSLQARTGKYGLCTNEWNTILDSVQHELLKDIKDKIKVNLAILKYLRALIKGNSAILKDLKT